MADPTKPARYAPRGVVTGRPILMRLMPRERAQLVQMARERNSSLSALARHMTLIGIQHYAGCESQSVQGTDRD